MNIEGKLNLSILNEALISQADTFESRLMNQRFENEAEKLLICAKLRHTRGLQRHVHAASLSNTIDKSIVIG